MTDGRRTRGEGSIFQRKDGLWVGRVDLGIIGNKRVRKQVTARTKRELTPKFRKLQREVEAGIITDDSTVAQWLDYWLDNIAALKLRPRTVDGYRSYIDRWIAPTIGRVRLADLKPDHVRAMHRKMREAGKSEATVRQAHAILHRALHVAEQEDKVARNVAGKVDAPAVSKNHHAALELHHCATLLRHDFDTRTLARLAMAILMGLRQGEALGLCWEDVQFSNGEGGESEVYVHQAVYRLKGKGLKVGPVKSAASERWVPMVGKAEETLRAWWVECGEPAQGFVFPGVKGGEGDPRQDWQIWKDSLRAAGVPDVPLHGARASCASILDGLGFSGRLIADILGHAQVMVTQKHYTRSYGVQRRAALEQMTKAIEAA
jgi:integrase